MAEGIYVRNFSDILVYEIVYNFVRISVRDELLWIFEVIMHISCYKCPCREDFHPGRLLVVVNY